MVLILLFFKFKEFRMLQPPDVLKIKIEVNQAVSEFVDFFLELKQLHGWNLTDFWEPSWESILQTVTYAFVRLSPDTIPPDLHAKAQDWETLRILVCFIISFNFSVNWSDKLVETRQVFIEIYDWGWVLLPELRVDFYKVPSTSWLGFLNVEVDVIAEDSKNLPDSVQDVNHKRWSILLLKQIGLGESSQQFAGHSWLFQLLEPPQVVELLEQAFVLLP